MGFSFSCQKGGVPTGVLVGISAAGVAETCRCKEALVCRRRPTILDENREISNRANKNQ
jgi:hypothetical protein